MADPPLAFNAWAENSGPPEPHFPRFTRDQFCEAELSGALLPRSARDSFAALSRKLSAPSVETVGAARAVTLTVTAKDVNPDEIPASLCES